MLSDSSDEDIILYYYNKQRKNRQNKRRYWVHPYIKNNINCRASVAAKELQETDAKFLAFYRMSKESYINLVQLLFPANHKKNTPMRECVGAEERILITLRYLGTGDTFVSLGLYFARGDNTVSQIVNETTSIIWDILQEHYMPIPNIEQWKTIAERFYLLWNLPNCLGAIDGKHIRIEKLSNSGSTNYNYKSYHSIVLLACCDADGLFTLIETGYAGRNSDGGIFRASAIKLWIENNLLTILPSLKLPTDESNNPFPYYFAGDEAFPLLRYLMRPYPQRTLDNIKRIFNYRLSRGRRTIECSFGMMAAKFQVLNTPIKCRKRSKIMKIIKSVCVLHNYVRKREGIPYNPQQFEDSKAVNPNIEPQNLEITAQSSAYSLRNYLSNYFVTPAAALPWQWKYTV